MSSPMNFKDVKALRFADMTGVERLRYAVRVFNNCREGFNEEHTAEGLIAIAEAYDLCEWDLTPDFWTQKQIDEAKHGIVPRWEEGGAGLFSPLEGIDKKEFA